jgi:large subunit ribosomal protein L32e
MADTKKAPTTKSVKDAPKAVAESSTKAPKAGKSGPHKARIQPKLDAETKDALGQRAEKKDRTPRFRRHEWWRYKKLGGKHASWRVPRGIHSKTRRHFGYRPPLVSIGYRGPEAARGLHPSGFEEVLVHNEADVAKLNKTTQAARIGGTVGTRKAKLIVAEATKLGVRVLNAPQEA